MHTTNLKLDVKKQELDMALDDETRILKQSFLRVDLWFNQKF